jgi:hypothetical protein
MTAYLPDNKGVCSILRWTDNTEWNEYLNSVREAEILELGVVRVTPVPRQITPTLPYQVRHLLY